MIIPSQRHLFSIPRDVCYLNAAYMMPQTEAIQKAIHGAVDFRASPWGLGEKDFIDPAERLRALAAKLFGSNADDVALIPATSYGIATAARNITLEKGQKIIGVQDQFPSNVYTWQRMAEDTGGEMIFAEPQTGETFTDAILREAEIHKGQVAVFALPWCHWADGHVLDLVAISKVAKAVEAKLVLDITQSFSAVPFDLEAIDPDYAISSGYKWMMCPYGIGFMYVAKRNQQGRGLEENWLNRIGSENFARLVDYEDRYLPGARRFEMGGRASFANVAGAEAALTQLLDWGTDNIAETLMVTNDKIIKIFERHGFEAPNPKTRAPHLIGLKYPGELPADLPTQFKEAGVYLSVRGSSVRIAPHVHIDDEDLEALGATLKKVMG
jgi:selenocysteine lyase/cysteine desulfurase